MRFTRALTVLVALAGWLPGAGMAAQARLAVAANFADAARQLAAEYGRQSGHRIDVSAASTGKLYAQIRHGAPFDALLSADAATPRKLVAEGLADGSTLDDYAVGRLVLWSRDPALVKDGEALLRHGRIERLAIANPELAPYGAAAREVLRHVGRWDALKPRLAMGENIGQATQFVVSGAAPLGLLPRSLVLEARKTTPGSSWEVPASWHAPIVQTAVLMKRGGNNAAARGFLQYLGSPAAKARIRALGYD
ncbi:molybdate ABC transporter substrate-binding protein [Lysobacter daejeonensis GH1-9]|uniref:Molybdate ABC transporter substrate-binding protein n=1 Tax=Lysobacter daejeonensis GH1-9 TaxID=1385517 RepID=A0A0A0EXA1_9GAMM|nr:molybdate ABC transporter substrate-binding protein [Lysobacter daejeonensis]KGM53787.1 molybdate ABC transporter substrate-binding protein [Lysobacter daejeonensis GH1-9]